MEQFIENNLALALILVAWSLLWKGVALWRAARDNDLGWFIALLVVQTFGLLEILYFFGHTSDKNKSASEKRIEEEDSHKQVFSDR